LSERRVFAPYGLEGGGDGEKGKNLLVKKNGVVYNLGGKNAFQVDAGDIVIIMTPGN
jgi:5-oxoprolinase (ATP-hydrolysing)